MAKKSNFLKNLLTTVSTAALVASGGQTAYAAIASYTTDNTGAPTIMNGGGVNLVDSDGVATNFTNEFTHGVKTALNITVAGAGTIVGMLDLRGFDMTGRSVTISDNVTIRNVVDNVGTRTVNLAVGANYSLTLTGSNSITYNTLDATSTAAKLTPDNTSNYNAMGAITTGANSQVILASVSAGGKGFNLSNKVTIDGTAGGNGSLVAADNGTYNIAGKVGGVAAIGLIGSESGGTINFAAAVSANNARIGNSGTLSFAGATNIANNLLFTAGGGTANLTAGYTGGIDFGGVDGVVNATTGVKIDGTVQNNSTTGGKGTFNFSGGNSELTGALGNGTTSRSINQVTVSDNALTLSKAGADASAAQRATATHNVANGFVVKTKATLNITGNYAVLNSSVRGVGGDTSGGTLLFTGVGINVGNGFTIGAIGVPMTLVQTVLDGSGAGDATVLPSGDHYATNFTFVDVKGQYNLQDGANLHGIVGDSVNDSKGVLFVLGKSTVDQIGTAKNKRLANVTAVTGGGALTLGGVVHFSKVFTVDTDSTIIVQDGGALNTGAGGGVVAGNDGKGTLIFQGVGGILGPVGTVAASLKEVQVNGVLTIDSSTGGINHGVNQFSLQVAASNLTFVQKDGLKGSILNTSGTDKQGNLTITAGLDMTAGGGVGTIGANGAALAKTIIIDGELNLPGTKHYTAFDLQATTAKITVADGGYLYGAIDSSNTKGGVLAFTLNGQVIGSVGAINALTELDLNGAGTVLLSGVAGTPAVFRFGTIKLNNANSVLSLADQVSLFGNITGTAGPSELTFTGNGSYTGNADVNVLIRLTGAGTVTLSGTSLAPVSLENTNAILTFASDGDSIGAVDALAANNGVINVNNNATINGKVGGVNGIKAINFTAAGKTLTVKSAATTTGRIQTQNGISFAQGVGGTLVISGTDQQNQAIDSAVVILGAAATESVGSITLDPSISDGTNIVTFSKAIGDALADKSLDTLTVGKGVNFTLSDKFAIRNIVLQGASNIVINGASAVNRIRGITRSGPGDVVLTVSANTEFLRDAGDAIITFGDKTNKLKSFAFDGDQTVVIPNNLQMYLNTSVTNTLVNQGTFVFRGNAIIDAQTIGTSVQPINGIKAQGGKDTTVTLTGSVYTNTAIEVGLGTLELMGAAINSGGANIISGHKGTLKFSNTAPATVTTTAGVNGFGSIQIGNSSVTFATTAGVVADNIQFLSTTSQASVIFDANTDFGKIGVINATGQVNTIVIGQSTNFVTPINATANALVNIQLSGGITATIGTDLSKANIIANASGNGIVDFAVNGAQVNSIGGPNNLLNQVTFSKNATILSEAHAKTITVNNGIKATLGSVVDGTLALTNNSTASFGDAVDLTKATITNTNLSNLEFRDSATITDALNTGTTFNNINFTGNNQVIAIEANKFGAVNINFGNNIVQINDNNPTITGSSHVTNMNLQSNSVTFTDLHLEGNATINAIVSSSSTTSTPRITSTNLTVSNLTDLEVKLDDSSISVTNLPPTLSVNLIKSSILTGGPYADQINISQKNIFIEWAVSVDANGNVILTPSNNTLPALQQSTASASQNVKDNVQNLATAEQIVEILETLTAEKQVELIQGLIPNTNSNGKEVVVVTETVGNTLNSAVFNVSNRLTAVNPKVVERADSGRARQGVSSGDGDDYKYGAWLSPIFGRANQGMERGAAGYKAETYGGTLGFDAKLNNDTILGFACSMLRSSIKHKNFKAGDSTKIESTMFSIYGIQQVTDNWFAEGIATIGTSNVETRENRIISNTDSQTASGKYNSMSFGAEAMFGYSFVIADSSAFTPMLGLRYTRVNDGGYKESGTTAQNLSISRKASNKLDAVIGGRFTGGTFNVAELNVTPEIHTFVSHDLIGKTPRSEIRIQGSDTPLLGNDPRPNRTFVDVGVGANIDSGFMNYGVSYDLIKSTKYTAHQGSVKFRVNF